MLSSPAPVYLGLDPGASGGIAALGADGTLLAAYPLAKYTLADLWGILRTFSPTPILRARAVLEKVGGYIGGNPTPGSAMFSFGQGYGHLEMALTAARIPYEAIVPRRWQAALGIATRDNKGGENKTAFKQRLRGVAQRLFPQTKVTLQLADALLIAEYSRRLASADRATATIATLRS